MKGPWNIANPLTDDGRNKINEMFQELYNEYREAGLNAKEAREKAHEAVMKSDEAMALSERTQKELSQAILEGDSSPLGGQLSVGADGTIYSNPQERLVTEFNSVNQKLAQIAFSVRQFGAVGDGSDETNKLQQAIDHASLTNGRVLLEKNKTYFIDGTIGLTIPSNIEIEFQPNSKIKVLPTESSNYSVFNLDKVENVTIYNPHLVGEKDEHLGEGGEWGFGISIKNSKNIVIQNAFIEGFWGDGIYLGDTPNNGEHNSNINILGKTVIKNCRRQGVSVIAGVDCYIEYLHVEDIKGTQPEAAIDFEPNHPHQVIDNFELGTIKAIRCEEPALFVFQGSKFGITIHHIEAVDCRSNLSFHGWNQAENSGYINIGNVQINKLENRPILGLYDWFATHNPRINIDNIIVDYWDNSSDSLSATLYTFLRMELGKTHPSWLEFGGINVGNIHVNKGFMGRNFYNFYVTVKPGITPPAGLKVSDVHVGISPNSNIKTTRGQFASELPFNRETIRFIESNVIEAHVAGAYTNADTLIDREMNRSKVFVFNYDSARSNATNYPSNTRGILLELVGSANESFQIAFSTIDGKMYTRRIDANGNASGWREVATI